MKRILVFAALLLFLAVPAKSQTATFIAADTTTKGAWASYGSDGAAIAQFPALLPSYAKVTGNSPYLYTWVASTTDPRGLPWGAARVATCWYGSGWTTNISITDGATHKLAMYFVDWDSTSRTETVQVLNTATGAVIDTRPLSNFNGGIYLVWNVSGNVTVKITQISGANAVLSGIFFSPPAGIIPPPNPATPLTITTTAIPNVTVGQPYMFILTAAGGTAPYLWKLSAGTLPPGLSLSSGGVLSGTATGGIGTSQITITVTDSAHETISMTIGRA